MDKYLSFFKKQTSFDLNQYFKEALYFFTTVYPTLKQYYEGSLSANSASFKALNYMLIQNKKVLQLFQQHRLDKIYLL